MARITVTLDVNALRSLDWDQVFESESLTELQSFHFTLDRAKEALARALSNRAVQLQTMPDYAQVGCLVHVV